MSNRFRQIQKKLEAASSATLPPIAGVDLSQVKDPKKLAEGLTHHWAGRYQEAGQIYYELDRDNPPHIEARYLAALIAREAHDLGTGITLLHEVTDARPKWTEAHYNLGVLYEEASDTRTAEHWFDKTLAIDPRFASAWTNKGNMRLAVGDVTAALECYHTAYALDPKLPETRMNMAHALLMQGRYIEGWRCYEDRWRTPGFRAKNGLQHTTAPMWDGKPLDGKTLLVFNEQGFGDTIMMLRYLRPLVEEKGARLVVRVPPRLVGLVERNAPTETTVIEDSATTYPAHDAIVPWMSLPFHFNTDTDTIPHASGFIGPRWQRTVSSRPNVGLVWAGSPFHKNDRNRSMSPRLIKPLIEVRPGIRWLSFQVGPREQESHELGLTIPQMKHFHETANALAQIDLLITVDTGIAHLAGAQGVPTWLCIPAVPDMRWPLTGFRTPWYDSVRIFRQPMQGDWRSVITQLNTALVMVASRRGEPW